MIATLPTATLHLQRLLWRKQFDRPDDRVAGKSTLLQLLGGVLLPQGGDVRILGESGSALSAAQRDMRRADHVGFIFQQFNLVPYLSALENVLLPCRFSAPRRQAAQRDGGLVDEARRLLAALGLGDKDIQSRRAAGA